MNEVILTNEELSAKCIEWQRRLRLQDWIVTAEITRARDMGLSDVAGQCSWILPKRMARISVLDPLDYPPGLMLDQDMEVTLVHELLHLHLAPLHDADNDLAVEQAIEAISRALVETLREVVADGSAHKDAA